MSQSRPLPPPTVGLVLAFATIYLVWGSTYLAIRVAVETMPPFFMASFRFLCAGGLLLIFLLLKGVRLPTLHQWKDHAIVGTCLLVGGNATVCWAEERVPSGLTSLLIGGGPLIMVVLDWIRPGGSRPAFGIWLGVAVGSVGLFFLLHSGSEQSDSHIPLLRMAALVCGTMFWWIGSLYGKHTKSGGDPLMASATQMLCGAVGAAIVGLAAGEIARVQTSQFTSESWAAFAYLVVMGSLVAYPIYGWLLKNSVPSRISTFAYVNPIVAVFLGWLILGEAVTPRTLLSGAVIIAAVAIITVQKNRAPALSRSG